MVGNSIGGFSTWFCIDSAYSGRAFVFAFALSGRDLMKTRGRKDKGAVEHRFKRICQLTSPLRNLWISFFVSSI